MAAPDVCVTYYVAHGHPPVEADEFPLNNLQRPPRTNLLLGDSSGSAESVWSSWDLPWCARGKYLGRASSVKAYLIRIVDCETLSPRSHHGADDYIIPAAICCSPMIAGSTATMKNQTPKIVGIKTAPHEPKALQVGQLIPTHIKADDGRVGSRVLPSQLPRPGTCLALYSRRVESSAMITVPSSLTDIDTPQNRRHMNVQRAVIQDRILARPYSGIGEERKGGHSSSPLTYSHWPASQRPPSLQEPGNQTPSAPVASAEFPGTLRSLP